MYINLNTGNRQQAIESKDKIEAVIELGDAQVGLESALLYSAKVDMAQKLIDDTKTSVIAAHENKKPLITDVIAYNVNVANEMLGEQVFTMDDVEVGEEGIIGGIASGIKKFVEVIVRSIKAVIKFIGKMIKGIINFIKSLFGKGNSSSSGGGSSASSALNKIEDVENGNNGMGEEEARIESETINKEFKDKISKLHGLSIYCLSNNYKISINNIIEYKKKLLEIQTTNRELYIEYINTYSEMIDKLLPILILINDKNKIKDVVLNFIGKIIKIRDKFIFIEYTDKNGKIIEFILLGNNKGIYTYKDDELKKAIIYMNETDKDKNLIKSDLNRLSNTLLVLKNSLIPSNLDTIINIDDLIIDTNKVIVDVDIDTIDVEKNKKDLKTLDAEYSKADKIIDTYTKKLTKMDDSICKYNKFVDKVSGTITKESNKKNHDNETLNRLRDQLKVSKQIVEVGSELIKNTTNDLLAAKDMKEDDLEDIVVDASTVKIKLGRNKKGEFTINHITLSKLEKLSKGDLKTIANALNIKYEENASLKKIAKAIGNKYKNNEDLEKALQKAFSK